LARPTAVEPPAGTEDIVMLNILENGLLVPFPPLKLTVLSGPGGIVTVPVFLIDRKNT